ncbi:MAG: hypothetical protein K9J42_15490 [Sulfuritalea sp.]|nr:hypothetical protein [Sulfuritalea sp.]
MTYESARAAGPVSVWVALSETDTVYVEAAQALRAELERTQPGNQEWRIAHWSRFDKSTSRPHWIVAVGTAAQRNMQELFARDTKPPPLLSILVPRLTFERIADPERLREGSLSAVFLDQPASRQFNLIRLALPLVSTVGLLVGETSKEHLPAIEKAAKSRDFDVLVATVDQGELFSALQSVLSDAEVLLALPDPGVFNSQTAANILTAAYRRHVPLVGFSPAYVKAGALLALYSTPAQVGTRGGELLRRALTNKSLPPPQWPGEFTVSVNPDVAHSLGLSLDEKMLGEQLRRRERP